MRSIHWGIIGCGDVTEVKSGPALQKAANSSLVAVMRRNGTLARDYAERHGVPRWYDDAEALVRDPAVDAVYVATPPSSHKEYALLCARIGKPVYVEKPMAMNAAECQEMIDACRDAGVPLFVAYYRRALPRFLGIKKLIEDRTIGEIRYLSIALHQPLAPEEHDPATLPWRVRPEIAGGGKFVDLASHMLDFLDFTLGPIAGVQGFASNLAGKYPAEDIVTGSFRFESGVHGMGSWCFSAFEQQDRTEIIGTRGKIEYVTFDNSPVRVTTAAGMQEHRFEFPAHVQQPLIQLIVNELGGMGRCPSTGETAIRTSRVMDAMLGAG